MSPLELSGPERAALRKALLAAFSSKAVLRRMVSDQLDENLAVISEADSLEDVVFALITWASDEGRLADLVVGARNAKPGNPVLARYVSGLGLSSLQQPAEGQLEALVGPNKVFVDTERWRTRLAECEWCVCRVDRDQEGFGTGFLVGPDLVMTNHHVVQSLLLSGDAAEAARWTFRFDHKRTADGKVIAQGTSVTLAHEWRVDAAPPSALDTTRDPPAGAEPAETELDFALLRLSRRVGDDTIGKGDEAPQRKHLELRTNEVDFAAIHAIGILQHPSALAMKLALDMAQNLVVNNRRSRVRHTVPTLPGASGSPVFDSDWNLIAIHQGSVPTVSPKFNQAIPVAKIAARPAMIAALAGG